MLFLTLICLHLPASNKWEPDSSQRGWDAQTAEREPDGEFGGGTAIRECQAVPSDLEEETSQS